MSESEREDERVGISPKNLNRPTWKIRESVGVICKTAYGEMGLKLLIM